MMHFIYEEDGISVSMETDATSLYEGYDSGAGVLGHFQRFLAAAGYAIGPDDELTILHDGEVTVDKEHYLAEMEELDELREMAKAAKYTPDEITDCDDKTDDREKAKGDSTTESSGQWIEWHGGPCPVHRDTLVHVRDRAGWEATAANHASNWGWSHSGGCTDIVAYRVVE